MLALLRIVFYCTQADCDGGISLEFPGRDRRAAPLMVDKQMDSALDKGFLSLGDFVDKGVPNPLLALLTTLVHSLDTRSHILWIV